MGGNLFFFYNRIPFFFWDTNMVTSSPEILTFPIIALALTSTPYSRGYSSLE